MEWIVTEIDGKVASIATDYRHLAGIGAQLAALPPEEVHLQWEPDRDRFSVR